MNCKQCNTLLESKRDDSIYCNHNCQQKYFKRKQIILKRINKVENEISFLKELIFDKENLIEKKKAEDFSMDIEENGLQRIFSVRPYEEFKKVLSMTRADFKKSLFDAILKNENKYFNDAFIVKHWPDNHESLVDRYWNNYKLNWPKIKEDYEDYVHEIEQAKTAKANRLEQINEITLELDNIKLEIVEFEKELIELKEINLDRLTPKPVLILTKEKSKYKPQIRSYSGSEILRMEFDTLELDGELGRFLGKLQRERCAIALTGDSGAGKSTFSYQLAKAFLKKNLSVAYFALETGFTESVKQLIETHKINQYKFEAFDEGSIDDVRNAAPHFDCVIVDSYSKISAKPEDFESLRQDFPNTFFILIFQKTTDGKIRGGSSILFNSTATIDLRITKGGHRLALMQKSRYETENFVYSIDNDMLLKDDKTPINWSGIEENYTSKNKL